MNWCGLPGRLGFPLEIKGIKEIKLAGFPFVFSCKIEF